MVACQCNPEHAYIQQSILWCYIVAITCAQIRHYCVVLVLIHCYIVFPSVVESWWTNLASVFVSIITITILWFIWMLWSSEGQGVRGSDLPFKCYNCKKTQGWCGHIWVWDVCTEKSPGLALTSLITSSRPWLHFHINADLVSFRIAHSLEIKSDAKVHQVQLWYMQLPKCSNDLLWNYGVQMVYLVPLLLM